MSSVVQEIFDEQYITASEIMKTVGISRAGFLYARRSGKLPNPISANDGRVLLWRRHDIKPIVEAWKQEVTSRKTAA